MKREVEFRKLWENLKESDDVNEPIEVKNVEETNGDGETSLDAIIARLEDLVSRLENAVNNDSASEVEKKESANQMQRRISKRCRV